ncbi:MAG: hypothetical protein WBA18_10995 [Terracidiphilus sp.]
MRRGSVTPSRSAVSGSALGWSPAHFHRMKSIAKTGAFFIAVNALFAGAMLAAQGAAAPAPAGSASKPQSMTAPAHRKKPASMHANIAAAQPAPVPTVTVPPTPPPPDWPANDRPSEASVTWDSHGLRVVAANSSLAQIMKDISSQTGATLEGLGKDQRIFGIYGPGSARDVINQLLDGSGYNVLMIGDQGQGTPRQIILTDRSGASPQAPNAGNPAAGAEEETEAEQEAQQPEPPPQVQGPLGNGAPPVPVRSQQQMMEQLRERQQQTQQQQNPQ